MEKLYSNPSFRRAGKEAL